ncbi:MAG: phosphate ABC transporter, permease protein PstA [Firmicutes bacterium HGW-Firmicutes-1]|nr:MAG: phosphate ABC transporter, permease protein PstA [Firmicutes bacterium HGW-Firmicutes-1]
MKRSYINKGNISLKEKTSKGKTTNILAYFLIGLSTAFTIGVLLYIIGFVFMNGMDKLRIDFLTSDYDSKTSYVKVEAIENGKENKLGVSFELKQIEGEEVAIITNVESASLVSKGKLTTGEVFKMKKGDIVKKIGKTNVKGVSLAEINDMINKEGETLTLKVTRAGEGVFPMLVTTLMMIGLCLIIACPIGIFAAIYLTEYAKAGRMVTLIRFATESLSGIPSIIYGLFGMLFFVAFLKLGFSILAGALTLSIILLPVIIRQTEESLKAVPLSYREGSLGLGATKLHTIKNAVLPSAIPGIVVAIILSIGRIVGESAALLLTAGTVATIPNSIFSNGATLTVKAYNVAKEEGNIEMACAIGTVVIAIILVLNVLSKFITRKYSKIN